MTVLDSRSRIDALAMAVMDEFSEIGADDWRLVAKRIWEMADCVHSFTRAENES